MKLFALKVFYLMTKDNLVKTTPKDISSLATRTSEPQIERNSAVQAQGFVNEEPPRWGRINEDLKSALDTWSELSEKLAHKVSPEEEQLQDIKRLLGDLKAKLKNFE